MGVFSRFLDLLYPRKCVFCRKLLSSSEEGICPKCRETLPIPTGSHAETKGEFFDKCVSALYYADAVRESILRYKFNGITAYAKSYARLLADCIEEHYPDGFDMLTYVPVSRKRRRQRGYDQAKLLAEETAKLLGKNCETLLTKIKHIPAQSSLTEEAARRANVIDVYRVTDAKKVEEKRILLLDDIVTSGATLSEAARTLLMAGAESVCCATLCKAGK